MSKFLSNAAVTEFDNEVKHQYQGRPKLRSTVTIRTGVTGDTYKFARMGSGIANQKATGADLTPMDIAHKRQTAFLGNWNASEITDIFDQAEVNYDEKIELAQTVANSIGRREDQIIMDAAAAVSFQPTNDLDPDTGRIFDVSGTSNFSLEMLHLAAEHFNDIEAEMTDRHIILRSGALQALLRDTKVGSTDYNSVRALMNGEMGTFLGFNFHVIGSRKEGGLPGVAADRVAFAWHKPAIGLAIGIDMQTRVDWVPMKTAWVTNCIFKAGAVAREPQGIVKLQYDETV